VLTAASICDKLQKSNIETCNAERPQAGASANCVALHRKADRMTIGIAPEEVSQQKFHNCLIVEALASSGSDSTSEFSIRGLRSTTLEVEQRDDNPLRRIWLAGHL
jgi:hypothetical protein